MSESAPKPRSKRIYVYWGVALAVLLTLGLFCWLVVVPVLETRAIVERFHLASQAYPTTNRLPDPTAAVQALGGGEAALPRLQTYLRLPRALAPHRIDATSLIPFCGERALPALVDLLEDEEPGVRCLAIMQVGQLGGQSAAISLVPLLRHEDDATRALAALELGDLRAPGAVGPLRKLLSDANPKVRQVAAEALKKIKAAQEKKK